MAKPKRTPLPSTLPSMLPSKGGHLGARPTAFALPDPVSRRPIWTNLTWPSQRHRVRGCSMAMAMAQRPATALGGGSAAPGWDKPSASPNIAKPNIGRQGVIVWTARASRAIHRQGVMGELHVDQPWDMPSRFAARRRGAAMRGVISAPNPTPARLWEGRGKILRPLGYFGILIHGRSVLYWRQRDPRNKNARSARTGAQKEQIPWP